MTKPVRIFEVKYIPPNVRLGPRTKVRDLHNDITIYLKYSHTSRDSIAQVEELLLKHQFKVVGIAHPSLFIIDDFEKPITLLKK